MLRTQLFGVPAFSIDAQSLAQTLTGRRLALFAYLLCQEQPTPRSVLSDLLWANLPEDQARENLRSLLSHTRRVLGDYVVADRQAVVFNRAAPYWADVEAFNTFFVTGQARTEPALLKEILQLYRGEFLAGFYIQGAPVFEDWLLEQRQQWQTQAVQGWQQLAHYHFTQGDDVAGLAANERLLALEPWHEAAHRQRMVMLARSGQRDAALAYFEHCCTILREEVDAPPDDETVALYQQIKAGVWSLNSSSPTSQAVPHTVAPSPPTQRPAQAQTPATNGHTVVAPPTKPPVPMKPIAIRPATVTPDLPALAIDWGAVPHEPHFHGRAAELKHLQQWCVHERRRVVAVLGIGGQGKTALAVRFIRTLTEASQAGNQAEGNKPAPAFERVIWRSLLAAPPLTDILQDWLQQLSDQQVVTRPPTLDQQFTLLHDYLQRRRFLLVLDNAESILLDDGSGACRPGYEAYEQMWQLFTQRSHQSCLLLTSRERLRTFSSHEEQTGALRTLLLDGLSAADGQQLLRAHRVAGSAAEIEALLRCYSGNPLALKLVADTIDELFNGNVAAFLREETPFFADIAAFLDQQFARLSRLEVELLTWLALEQEPVTSQTLWENLVAPPAKRDFLTALRTLVRRSFVQLADERFSLQNVILEYARNRLVNEIGDELSSQQSLTLSQMMTADELTQLASRSAESGSPLDAQPHPLLWSAFNRYALLKAQAKAYVRASQQRLVLEPVVRRWRQEWGNRVVTNLFHRLLHDLRLLVQSHAPVANGYAASNLLHILLQSKQNCHVYDFSHLTLRQVYLRDGIVQGINFTSATLRDCLFTDVFAAATALAFHPSGEWVAIGTFDGTTRLVRLADHQVVHQLVGHAVTVFGLAISPDGKFLASSSSDQQVYVWDLESYTLRYRYQETVNFVRTVSFSPDSRWLAVAGGDGTVRLYAAASGHLCHTLHSPHDWVCTVAFSPDGQWLAAGGREGGISLWAQPLITTPPTPTYSLHGHARAIETLLFSHDSQLLFSGSRDQLIHVWQLPAPDDQVTERVQAPWRTLRGHRQSLRRLAISPNGRYLASGGADALVHLWDIRTGALVDTLVGHERWVWAVDFHPHMTENRYLLASAANDQRVLFWEINVQDGVVHSQLQQGISGYSDGVRALAFLPQSHLLVSGGFDRAVRVWDLKSKLPNTVLSGHRDWIFCVAASPDGRWLASAGYERLIYLWPRTPLPVEADSTTQAEVAPIRLSGHTSIISGLAFSPDGQTLASCCQESKICLWNIQEQRLVQTLHWQPALAWSVAFSPDGRLLASAHFDRTIHLWDVQSFAAREQAPQAHHLRTLTGHTGLVWMVAFSPDGQTVISTSNDHTVRVWDRNGEPRRILTGHTNIVRSLAVSPQLATGRFTIATGDDDKIIHIWDGQSGELLQRLHGHHGVIHALAYSPDGTILASASEAGGIRLWDVQSGAQLQTLRAPRPYSGMKITGVTGITPAQRAALLALGAVEQ